MGIQVKKICKNCGAEFMGAQFGKALYCISCRQMMRKRKDEPNPNRRRCHDCSRITYNYRCDACWNKLRKKLGLGMRYGEEE